MPLQNLISHTWSLYKMFDIAWCDKYDLSVLCLYSVLLMAFGPGSS